MRKGKLTNEELNSCLSVIKNNNEDLVALKGGIGEDCAVVKGFGDMLVTSDPICLLYTSDSADDANCV